MNTLPFLIFTMSLSTASANTEQFIDNLNERINYVEYTLEANNASITFDTPAQKNNRYLNQLRLSATASEYNKITAELRLFEKASSADIDKEYVKKIQSEKMELSEANKKTFSSLMEATNKYLSKNTLEHSKSRNFAKTLAANVKEADLKPVPVPAEEVAKSQPVSIPKNVETPAVLATHNEDESRLKEASESFNAKDERYEVTEDDSIFQIITKRYIKSYPRLRK